MSEFEALKLTLAPWRITERRIRNVRAKPGSGDEFVIKKLKALALTGPISQYSAGTVTPRTSLDQQVAIIHAPHTGTMVIDVDDPEFTGTPVAEYLAGCGYRPICTRGAQHGLLKEHYLVDAREIAAQGRWVTQGPIIGGDVKSNGFTPMPGCTHPSGDLYEPVVDENGNLCVVPMDEELFQLLTDAREAKKVLGGGLKGADGGSLGAGQEPALFSYTGTLVTAGLSKEEARAAWFAKAKTFPQLDPIWAWHEEDPESVAAFERHWSFCTTNHEKKLADMPEWDLIKNTPQTVDIPSAAPTPVTATSSGQQELLPGHDGGAVAVVVETPDPGHDELELSDDLGAIIEDELSGGNKTGLKNEDRWGNPFIPTQTARAAMTNVFCRVSQRTGKGELTLRHWREAWMWHEGPHWTESHPNRLSARLYTWLEHATYKVPVYEDKEVEIDETDDFGNPTGGGEEEGQGEGRRRFRGEGLEPEPGEYGGGDEGARGVHAAWR